MFAGFGAAAVVAVLAIVPVDCTGGVVVGLVTPSATASSYELYSFLVTGS
jgi:hypothetical protein